MENPLNILNVSSKDYLDSLYRTYQDNPLSVEKEWRTFFQGFELGFSYLGDRTVDRNEDRQKLDKSFVIYQILHAYRKYGHLGSHDNPLTDKQCRPKQLNLQFFHIDSANLEMLFPTLGILPQEEAPLKEIIAKLDTAYLGSIAVETTHIDHTEIEEYIHQRILSEDPYAFPKEEKERILNQVGKAQLFEEYLQVKFTGAKRFSLEGLEAAVPALFEMFCHASANGTEEVFIGMAHRGRLNILAHLLQKPYEQIFDEFAQNYFVEEGQGDVKYHKGAHSDLVLPNGEKLSLRLAANPSHLEAVDPVVLGMVKGRQIQKRDTDCKKVLPVILHGDAAISGQGVVYEMMQLARIPGYTVGGAIQLIINNQIGYTATPDQYKSMKYASDIAKTFGFPVFHVNSLDVEAVVYVTKLAMDIRNRFGANVMINLHGYRKYGHNESDEPRFTQPLLYERLRNIDTAYVAYIKKLSEEKLIDKGFSERLANSMKTTFEEAFAKAETFANSRKEKFVVKETKECEMFSDECLPCANTAVQQELLTALGISISTIPKVFDVHKKLRKLFDERKTRFTTSSEEPFIDWATAEYLCYASLLNDGYDVRISGQDSIRGTFAHRHAYVYSQTKEEKYSPLSALTEQQRFDIYNSILSEYAVMGFEYGYSLIHPKTFVMWEGQFGDFANGGQIIIDQFLFASLTKWRETVGLTLFLPHGLEGMGPEHSSCRLERFLQMTCENNVRICQCTTPGQLFHLFRRQMLCQERRPLIVASGKGLLRLRKSFSTIKELTEGEFEEVLDDPGGTVHAKRLVLCTGKLYYDLVEAREKVGVDDLVILRIEQLYPLATEKLKTLVNKYTHLKQVFWVQEEHRNQGAWPYIQSFLKELFAEKLSLEYLGRERSASSASGSAYLHQQEQAVIVKTVMERGKET